MKVYSPTQTMTWLRCPIKRMLDQAGWAPRYIGKKDQGAVLGQAFGAGVEAHYAKLATSPADVARAVAQVEVKALVDAGRTWYEGEEGQATVLPTLAAKAVEKYLPRDPLPQGWEVLDIQREMPDHGRSRIDLGVRNHAGQLGVIDIKFKRTLDARYRQRTLDEYRWSWQFNHYTWAYGEVMQEPVAFRQVYLTVMEPRYEVIVDTVPTDEELQERWLASAKRVWAQMEAEDTGEALPWESHEHYDRYGKCEFYEACFDYKLEEGLMRGAYVRESQ